MIVVIPSSQGASSLRRPPHKGQSRAVTSFVQEDREKKIKPWLVKPLVPPLPTQGRR
jgi:hypothetical protein